MCKGSDTKNVSVIPNILCLHLSVIFQQDAYSVIGSYRQCLVEQ